MADLRLSDDGLYYWDGQKWVSTVSPDGRFRWNGSAWVPVTGSPAPGYTQYRQPPSVRVPTSWTLPMQYAVAAWYVLSGIYALSLPFWLSDTMARAMNQSFQRQVQLSPRATPPPPEFFNAMTSMMSGLLWVTAIIAVAICAVAVIGALKRWTWTFWVILVLMGLGTLSLPFNLVSALLGTRYSGTYGLPTWSVWLSVAYGIPGAALFVWMLVALIRYGPWAMTRKFESAGAGPVPAS